MMNLNTLNETHLDFFKELENIGASHAATALSKLIGRKIRLRVPSVRFCEFNEVTSELGGPETLVVSVLVEMKQDLTGFIMLVQDVEGARALSSDIVESMGITSEDTGELLTEMQMDVLMEVCNILSSAYLSAIGTLTGLSVKPVVPKMVIDMAGAIMNLPATIFGQYGDVVLFLETEFFDESSTKKILDGHFLLVPDANSYATLLRTMGIE